MIVTGGFNLAALFHTQVMMNSPINPRCDVFSYGMILLEMVSGKKPFDKIPELLVPVEIIHKKV